MGKRVDRKRLMRSLKRTANRIPLGAEHLPKWLKSHFPHIYAQHVAYRMINGKQEDPYKPWQYSRGNSTKKPLTQEKLRHFMTEALRA